MANNYTGRVWKIDTAGTTPFGIANVKFSGGIWSGMTASGQTFIITDSDGRAYKITSQGADIPVQIPFFGVWLSGPLAFSGTFTGEIDLYLSAGK